LSASALAGDPSASPVRWRAGERIANWAIAGLVFLSGFVIVEPSPYDLLLVATVFIWALFGLRINRFILPMTLLMLAYLAGGFLSLTQINSFVKPTTYMLVTGFLVASSVFFASVLIDDPERRFPLIRNAYIASAIIVSLIAILAYFNAIPHADFFKLYDRAKGTFQDPNVFGPFLALPAAFLIHDILTRRLRESVWEIVGVLIIVLAVFLSFSRAAWGMVAFAALAVAYFAFVNEARQIVRFRLVAYLIAGGATVAILIAGAISIPQVRDLYEVRAHVVQDYDEGRVGRFERQQQGFFTIQEAPLGLGPYEFGKRFGEDEHNMWLKGFTTYGWLGGFSYIILAIWTLAAAAPLLFKPRPWQPIVQATYAVFIGHILIHNVIDNDHWRHVFLIYGILWGAIASEEMLARRYNRIALPRARSPAR
jgi:hypothetical protein